MSDNVLTDSNRTAVVIPTRNRADLAINAIRSVLDQPVDDLRLIVSDNSTAESEKSVLADFCHQLSDPRLLYIAPLKSTPVAEHWDWAMSQALQRCDAGHFIYLTDRSVFKPGVLLNITKLARQYSDKVISFDWVTIFDHLSPIIVERQRQTGQLLEVTASRLLFLSSRSIFPHSLPRMMNCCVPRSLLERMQARFGNIFASTAPDYSFCYRSLELVDSILYYDYAAFVSYAILRSNGVLAIGIKTEANVDFMANLDLGGRRMNYAAPVPVFKTATNYVMHEYCFVQRETDSQKFPTVDRARYLLRNFAGLLTIVACKLPWSVQRRLTSLRTRVRKVLNLQWPTIAEYERYPAFESVGEAIDYAIRVAPNDSVSVPHLDLLRGNARS